ncbi:MAG: hypothetical protein J1F07_08255 [Muribaculaceae bacterium]|nr:hypothetical protein [Muribaculaceae bacterium]
MKSIKTLFCAALAAMMLTACSDEQTSFNVDKVPGRGEIRGTIVYNTGAELVDGKFVYDFKPAANVAVYVYAQNSDYSNSLDGQSIFTTTTDENGDYKISIPVTEDNMKVTIRTAAFDGVQTFVEIINGEVVQRERPVVYRGNYQIDAIDNHDIVYANFQCAVTSSDTEYAGFTEVATVKGQIGQNYEYYTAPEQIFNEEKDEEGNVINKTFAGWESAFITYLFTPAANVDLIVSVNYSGAGHTGIEYPTGTGVTYNVTTDANGNFELLVPVAEFPASFSYSIEALTYEGTFVHYNKVVKEFTYPNENADAEPQLGEYIDYEPVTLNGWYAQKYSCNASASFPVASVVSTMPTTEGKIMVFDCLESEYKDLETVYSQENWNSESKWLEEYLQELADQEEAEAEGK